MKIKISKGNFITGMACILISAFAILFSILNEYSFGKPISSFVLFMIIMGLGFGLILFCSGIAKRIPFFLLVSSLFMLIGLTLLLAVVAHLIWWLIIVVDIFVLFVFVFVSYSAIGNGTESVAMNNSPEYKTYKQRTAEKEESKAKEENKELPKLKSYSEDKHE